MDHSKGSHKYDWPALRLEFMNGKWKTVGEFCKYKGMPPPSRSGGVQLGTRGWSAEKKERKEMIAAEAQKALDKQRIFDEKEAMARQVRLGRYLQLVGAESLKGIGAENIKDADTARKLIVAGMKEEREAMKHGKEKKGGVAGQSLTQVNIKLPGVKLDEVLDELDYEGTLRLLAEVKRTRANRAGEPTIIDGEEEG